MRNYAGLSPRDLSQQELRESVASVYVSGRRGDRTSETEQPRRIRRAERIDIRTARQPAQSQRMRFVIERTRRRGGVRIAPVTKHGRRRPNRQIASAEYESRKVVGDDPI